VVIACHAVITRIHNELDGILLIEERFAFIERFLACGEITKEELGVSDGREREGVSFGNGAGWSGLGGCVVGRFDGVRGCEAGMDRLEECKCKVGFWS